MIIVLTLYLGLFWIYQLITKDPNNIFAWIWWSFFFFFVAVTQFSPNTIFDTGAYHVVIANALAEHGLVKGIANLDPTYGLFSPVFILGALVEQVYSGHSWQIVNGTIYIIFAIIYVRLIKSLNKNKLPFIVAGVLSFFYSRGYIATLSPDLFIFLSIPLFLLTIYKFLQSYNESILPYTVMFTVIAFWVKFSAASLVPMVLVVLIIFRNQINLFDKKWKLSLVLSFAVVSSIIGVNIFQTGYPLYPVSIFATDVPWQLPINRLLAFKEHLFLWGIDPTLTYTGDSPSLENVYAWFLKSYSTHGWLLLAFLASPFLLFSLHKTCSGRIFKAIVFVGYSAHLILWMIGSPNFRFLAPWVVVLFGLSLGFAIENQEDKRPSLYKIGKKMVFIGLSFLAFQFAAESGIRSKIIAQPRNLIASFPIHEQPLIIERYLSDGNPINIPLEVKQPWYAPFPCSRQFPVHAVGNIETGFFPSESAYSLKTPF